MPSIVKNPELPGAGSKVDR